MIVSKDFPYITEKVNRLSSIVNRYDFEDVATAAFCLSVCVNNRAALESSLALNWAIENHTEQGKERITSYGDFVAFFDSVKETMMPESNSDTIEEDFGDVSIEVYGKRYSVIIGTGYNMVFACLQLLPYLAEEVGKRDELVEVIEYYSFVIDFLKEENVKDGKHEVRYVLPSEKLYAKVRRLFSALSQEQLKKMDSLLDSNYIEKRHFVNKNGRVYPVANTSLLLDLYDKWYRQLNPDQQVHLVNKALAGISMSLSKLEKENRVEFLCPVTRADGEGAKTLFESYPFVLVSSKGIILPIVVKSTYTDEEIDNLCAEIEKAKREGGLYFAERISRRKDGKCRGVTISQDTPIEFMVVDAFSDPEAEHMHLGTHDDKYFCCSALDIVYYLCFMRDTDELFDYLNYDMDNPNAVTIGFGGDAARFLMWQESGHMFERGAVSFGVIDVGHDTENEVVADYYRNKLSGFPIGRGDYILDNPFSWNIQEKGNGFYEYVLKGKNGFGGLFCPFKNGLYFFFPHNGDFYESVSVYTEYKEIIHLMDDLFQRMMCSLRSTIEQSRDNSAQAVQVMMMPLQYGKRIDKTGALLAENRTYAYSDAYEENGKIVIRFVPIIDRIVGAIAEAETRTAEVDVFVEVMNPLSQVMPLLYEDISRATEAMRAEKKEISVSSYEVKYKWSQEEERYYRVGEDAYMLARKHIAKVCHDAGIESGRYFGNEATNIVRKMQQRLISDFEDEVRKYDYLKLHEKALSVYASLIHEVLIHRKRYEGIGEVKEETKQEVSYEIIKQREEAKHNARTVLYLIETVLFLGEHGTEMITNERLEYMLAYANWLVVLSDDADMCHFTEKEVYVEITSEYLVDVDENTESREVDLHGLARRMYDNPGFIERDKQQDDFFFGEVNKAFQIDTGVSLEDFLAFLYYLESGGGIGEELFFRNNVLCFWKDDIIRDYCNIQKTSNEVTNKMLDLVCIETSELKTQNGRKDYYLPIGEKEKRENRYEVRPLVEHEDMIVYAPVVIHFLREYWQNSLFEFCMPYEIGMNETKHKIDEWKRIYEKKIVFDLENVFIRKGCFARHNFELKKLGKGKYPNDLGDYDVLAINRESKEIWIVECKVLEKVETFYEVFRQQNRFFFEDRYDEKFQKRIDYMRNHYNDVLSDLGFPQDEYTIQAYMCTNKVFVSRYKKIGFPILSYQELADRIEATKTDEK